MRRLTRPSPTLLVLLAALATPGVVRTQEAPRDEPAGLTVELRAEHGERVVGATLVLRRERDEGGARDEGEAWDDGTAVGMRPDGAERFRADELAAGRYTLEVAALGYETATRELSITAWLYVLNSGCRAS